MSNIDVSESRKKRGTDVLARLESVLQHRLAAATGTHAETVESVLKEIVANIAKARAKLERGTLSKEDLEPIIEIGKNILIPVPGQIPILRQALNNLDLS